MHYRRNTAELAFASMNAAILGMFRDLQAKGPHHLTSSACSLPEASHAIVGLDPAELTRCNAPKVGSLDCGIEGCGGFASFGIVTTRDIVMGFDIIREWEFSKYGFNQKEREIARMILDGLSNDQIAMNVCLGISAVKYHIKSIFRKASLKKRSEFGSLMKRGMTSSTRQWSSRREMSREFELLKSQWRK